MMHWGNFGGTGFGWIIMILFWALIILGIAYLFTYISGRNRTEGPKETALDILKKRYAQGEISKEEFEEKKKDIL